MLTLVQDMLRLVQTELKARDSNQQLASLLALIRDVVRLTQEQTVHVVATVFVVYLIFGWNVYLVGRVIGFLLSVYASLLIIDLSVTINETTWLFYWIVYVSSGFLEYLCSHCSLLFRLLCLGKCLLLLGLTLPELMHDNVTICYRSVHQLMLNYRQENQGFYNTEAGQSYIEGAQSHDEYNNPTDREYDLGRDGAFVGYRILIGQFYKSGDMRAPIEALEMKGFQVENVKTEVEFLAKLQSTHYHIAWVISSTLIDFHTAGGAVFLFADNVPYVAHASAFLDRKFGMTLTGKYQGNKTLSFSENGYSQAGRFGQHEIFTGIKNLFEGVTICHPVCSKPRSDQSMATLATATDGQSCITAFDPPLGSSEGRLCLDCGFTKLFINWNSAGTARFIVNTSCWLAKAAD